ncbi:MAG TPA: purine-nucleoside phosphorylase [Polyangia bacterium]|nr:purine-nucleoside phosphorylase [Polyangia bacterium]
MTEHDKIAKATEFLRLFAPAPPRVALVLGSGLGSLGDALEGARVTTTDIPHFPRATVPGHAGTLVLGKNGVLALSGRVHLYEGYSVFEVVFPVRVLIAMGARTLILTNAAGGLDPRYRAGELVVISDHINLTGQNPLRGANDERMGPRFPDLSEAYHPSLRALAEKAAAAAGLGPLREGVYAGLAGPSYETPAEVRMLRALGADLVGMSTVLETIAAVHMGARVLGISCVANLAAGLSQEKLTHDEVMEAGRQAAPRFRKLLDGVIDEILR